MKQRPIRVPLAGEGQATLTLPVPITRERLTALEHGLWQALQGLRRSLPRDPLDPALIEYASWLPDRRA